MKYYSVSYLYSVCASVAKHSFACFIMLNGDSRRFQIRLTPLQNTLKLDTRKLNRIIKTIFLKSIIFNSQKIFLLISRKPIFCNFYDHCLQWINSNFIRSPVCVSQLSLLLIVSCLTNIRWRWIFQYLRILEKWTSLWASRPWLRRPGDAAIFFAPIFVKDAFLKGWKPFLSKKYSYISNFSKFNCFSQ